MTSSPAPSPTAPSWSEQLERQDGVLSRRQALTGGMGEVEIVDGEDDDGEDPRVDVHTDGVSAAADQAKGRPRLAAA